MNINSIAVIIGFLFCISQAHSQSPYPPSKLITGVEWAPVDSIIRLAKGCDNFPLTWADDGHLYSAYGDGNGFKPNLPQKLSMGFVRVEGNPPNIKGFNIRTESGEQFGDGRSGLKASGILMVDGVVYLWCRNAKNSQLAWSSDHGETWEFSDWKFTESFGYPTFINYGKNYANSRDDYVYIVSHDEGDAYRIADRMVLAKVHKDHLRVKDQYEFFVKRDESGNPIWSKNITERGAVFENQGSCCRSGITYNAGLKRYLWCQILPGNNSDKPDEKVDTRFEGGFGIYDAPEPWGPWTTVFYTEDWDVGPGETSSLPTKWMSDDGKTCHLVFSGDDSFSVREVNFEIHP